MMPQAAAQTALAQALLHFVWQGGAAEGRSPLCVVCDAGSGTAGPLRLAMRIAGVAGFVPHRHVHRGVGAARAPSGRRSPRARRPRATTRSYRAIGSSYPTPINRTPRSACDGRGRLLAKAGCGGAAASRRAIGVDVSNRFDDPFATRLTPLPWEVHTMDFSRFRHTLAAPPHRNDLLVGVTCMTLGALALTLAWFAFRGGVDSRSRIARAAVNSNAGPAGDIVPDPDGLPAAALPLHKRSDYRVEPPDILSIRATRASHDAADKEPPPINGETHIEGDGSIELDTLGSLHVEGLTPAEIEHAIEQRAAAQHRDWQVDVSVFAQNSKVYYLIFENQEATDVQRHTVVGGETVSDALAGVSQLGDKRVFVARATSDGAPAAVLPVEWEGDAGQITCQNNFELQPGDRVFVEQLAWWEQLLNKMAAMVRDQATDLSDNSKPAETHSY